MHGARLGNRRRSGVRLAGWLAVAASVGAANALAGPSSAEASPSDPQSAGYFSDQWGLTQIDAPAAWQFGNGTGVKIGIVDTGVDSAHPDLSGKVVAAATCANTGGDPARCATSGGAGQDDNGHGTHVAGIAAASGIGVAGVAPGASLVVAKVLDAKGSGSTSDVAAGIAWVVAHGAKVVNLSLGPDTGLLGVNCAVGAVGGCQSSNISGAVEAAWNEGAIPVVAAGNNAGDLFGPGGYGNLDAIVVAATGPSGKFASDYSSTPGNAKWGVLAPGGDDPSGATAPTCGQYDPTEILSTYWSSGNSCYATDEGTSMATPFVSGTLALLLGRGLSQQQAVQVLLASLKTSVNCGNGQGCLGLIDAGAAMAQAARTSPGPGRASASDTGGQAQPSGGSQGPRANSPAAGLGAATGQGGSPVPSTIQTGTKGANGSGAGDAAGASSDGHGLRSSSGAKGGSSLPLTLLLALAACALIGTFVGVRRHSRKSPAGLPPRVPGPVPPSPTR
jgi:subtilisin family serine protease